MSSARAGRRRGLAVSAALAAMAGAGVVAAVGPGDSDDGLEVVSRGTAHDAYFGLAFQDHAAIAVGSRGMVAQSSDGGRTWALDVASPARDVSLLAVAMEGSRRIAVGQSGVIVHTDDGRSWTAADSGTTQRLFGVALNADGLAAAVGGFGALLVSDDAGARWRESTIDWSSITEFGASPHLYDAHVSASGEITVVGEFGLVLRSANRGASWRVLHQGEASLFEIELRPDGVGYAVGQAGTVLQTSDGGETWAESVTGSDKILLGVSSTRAGRVVVSGMRTLLLSDDGGRTWREATGGDFGTNWYQRVQAFDGERSALVAGHSGRIVSIGGRRGAAAPDKNTRGETT